MNVYDFDGTIYNGDSTIDFYLYTLKKNPLILKYAPKQALGFMLYAIKQIKKTQLKEYFFSFLKGITAEKLVEGFWNENEHKIYQWYLNQKKSDDIIISASPEFLLKPICNRIEVEKLLATKVEISSGNIEGENCYGHEKLRRLKEEWNIVKIDEFYSDSLSDLPLADIAEKAFYVSKGTISKWDSEGKNE